MHLEEGNLPAEVGRRHSVSSCRNPALNSKPQRLKLCRNPAVDPNMMQKLCTYCPKHSPCTIEALESFKWIGLHELERALQKRVYSSHYLKSGISGKLDPQAQSPIRNTISRRLTVP